MKNIVTYGNLQMHKSLVLQNVLHLPSFKQNLLSISQLSKSSHIKFNFYPSFCVLQDQTTEAVIVVGKLQDQLYILDINSFLHETIQAGCNLLCNLDTVHNLCFINNISMTMWHQRMGHPYENVLKHLPFYIAENKNCPVCDVCHFAKQTRLLFPMSTIVAVETFDIVHVDIYGPYKHESITGVRYFLTLVDDHSKVTWIFLMREKVRLVMC